MNDETLNTYNNAARELAEYFRVACASVDEIAGKPWVVMALRKK